MSRFADGEQIFEQVSADNGVLSPAMGSAAPLAESYCQRVLDGRLDPAVPNARRDLVTRELSITRALNIGAYVGVPVLRKDGEPYGMLCCMSHQPRPRGSDGELATMRLLAQMLGEIVDRSNTSGATRADMRERVAHVLAGNGRGVALQPVVDLHTGMAIAVEALSRFEGPPAPDAWFADAMSVGLGVELEVACAATAFETLARADLPDLLAVNLSPAALLSPLCNRRLESVDRRRLVIEITEHSPVDDYQALIAALAPHRDAGAQVAIDDAGAGYASFRHILQLSPDFIKVDIGLVRDIDVDPVRQSLITALGSVARTAGARLIAEGVEAQAELDMLYSLEVTLAQGYLLGRPTDFPPSAGYQLPASSRNR